MQSYRRTRCACYSAYMLSAVINNFPPLLFLILHRSFGISFTLLGVLITVSFSVQAVIDFTGARLLNRIGYRRTMYAALFFSALGLAALGILPYIFGGSFLSFLCADIFYAVGSGLIEILVSPIIAAIPSENTAASMHFLHSFYSWGQMLVILVSTAFFAVFGLDAWRFLSLGWILIPLFSFILFWRAPIPVFGADAEKIPPTKLLKSRFFLLLLILMLAAGAAELSMSQWASVFAEEGLHLSKTAGDLLGPCLFALCMGLSRILSARLSLPLLHLLLLSALLCVFSYLLAALSPYPVPALIGCALCGFSVGALWPGILSLAASRMPGGGGAMLALLAFGGDVGCSAGPGLVGFLADRTGRLESGLLFGSVFPFIILFGSILLLNFFKKNEKN